jgi:hypothetical protein
MEEELEINRETICKTLVEDLGKREICARFVSHSLVRLQACQEFIHSVDDDPSFLGSIITGDET